MFLVLLQAFIIALTTDFIPRMYFLFVSSENFSFDGYLNSTLAGTSTQKNPRKGHQFSPVKFCQLLVFKKLSFGSSDEANTDI